MKKGLIIVLSIIFILVVFLIIWEFVMGNTGILYTAYNALANVVNEYWGSLTGHDALLPTTDKIGGEDGSGGLPTNPFGN